MPVYIEPSGAIYPLVVSSTPSIANMSRDEFFELCERESDLCFERTADGDLMVMLPNGGETGRRYGQLIYQFATWNKQADLGVAFSWAGFWLPNGAERCSGVSWMCRQRWESLGRAERERFPPLAPEFVMDLRSDAVRMGYLRAKMQEFIENGVRLAWLIDPMEHRVEIYRPGQTPENLEAPARLSGDPELPGFVLDLAPVW